MTASYVLVTFAAVALVEILVAAFVFRSVNTQADLTSRVVTTANAYSIRYGVILQKMVETSDPSAPLDDRVVLDLFQKAQVQVGDPSSRLNPGEERPLDSGVLIPHVDGLLSDKAPMSLALILSPKSAVYASSYPQRYAPGSAAEQLLPVGWQKGTGISKLGDGRVAWATQPIFRLPPDATAAGSRQQALADKAAAVGSGNPTAVGKGGKGSALPLVKEPPLGYVYVQVPFQPTGPTLEDLKPQLQSGLIFLLATIPVGVLFGMLTTRGVIRRLRRLAAGTVGFAAGDFSQRVPESGRDEVGQLERHFNRMAERLDESIAEQRTLAEKNARLAERSRISRELHDSISQDLFSISALAGGLRKALPEGSSLQPQLETLSATVASTIQEMRALLLELRPTALEEKGLVPALADLCDAYEVRVGVRVHKELAPVSLDPAVEQAVFRIAQEGLSNAVRHSEADEIEVRLRQEGAQAEFMVSDNGRGFDRKQVSDHGLGLKLMAERIRELGGSLAVESALGRGTALRVLLPAAAPSA